MPIRRKKNRFLSFFGLGLIALGLTLLAAGGAYYVYTWQARSNLDSLNVTAKAPEQDAWVAEETGLQSVRDAQGQEPARRDDAVPTATATPIDDAPEEDEDAGLSAEAIASQSLFPGEGLQPVFWLDPWAAEAAYALANPLLEEFEAIDAAARNSLPPPVSISIPAIGLDSEVRGLAILDLGDNREYETPKNVVGHIPETASVGENGTAWFFGHLESPISGEGNVFAKLPKIADLLREGPVYATVDNGDKTFLYRLTASRVVHQDELRIHELGGPAISLVTCVPRFEYDYRLMVTGALEGVKG